MLLMKNRTLVCGSMALSITPEMWRHHSQRGLYLKLRDRKKSYFKVYTPLDAAICMPQDRGKLPWKVFKQFIVVITDVMWFGPSEATNPAS